MKTEDYAIELRSVLQFNRYVALIDKLGNTLNDRNDRFDKSAIIEQSIEVYSDGRLKWVDLIGRDHHDAVYNLDLEFKYRSNCMFTPKGTAKSSPIKIKLKNSLGQYKDTQIDNPADFYMVGQQNAIGIISWHGIKKYLHAVPDGIEAHIPFEKINFIFTPSDVSQPINSYSDVDYKQVKAESQRKLIESIA